jgi:hypothetical protein
MNDWTLQGIKCDYTTFTQLGSYLKFLHKEYRSLMPKKIAGKFPGRNSGCSKKKYL